MTMYSALRTTYTCTCSGESVNDTYYQQRCMPTSWQVVYYSITVHHIPNKLTIVDINSLNTISSLPFLDNQCSRPNQLDHWYTEQLSRPKVNRSESILITMKDCQNDRIKIPSNILSNTMLKVYGFQFQCQCIQI